jgi:hypothetical protein
MPFTENKGRDFRQSKAEGAPGVLPEETTVLLAASTQIRHFSGRLSRLFRSSLVCTTSMAGRMLLLKRSGRFYDALPTSERA